MALLASPPPMSPILVSLGLSASESVLPSLPVVASSFAVPSLPVVASVPGATTVALHSVVRAGWPATVIFSWQTIPWAQSSISVHLPPVHFSRDVWPLNE